MIRLTKLADYGFVVLHEMSLHAADSVHTARDLAVKTELPLPTVSKILKTLAKDGLVRAHRGVKGGYSLSRHPQEINVADVIAAFEGPVLLTECVDEANSQCEITEQCPSRRGWQRINEVVIEALRKITLAQLFELDGAADGACSCHSHSGAAVRPKSDACGCHADIFANFRETK